MKKGKSPVAANDLTTPQKKLKQARLPFKLLSDVSPKPETPPSRKRKLSTPLDEVAPKIGKVSIENDLKDALVLISDDDSKDVENSTKDDGKTVNPLAKLVDTAWKKKLQKTKAGKKKKSAKNKHKNENSENSKEPDKNEAEPVGDDNIEDVVMMDLSEGPTNETKASEAVAVANKPVRKTRSSIIPKKTSSPSKICEKNNNKKAKATSLKKTIDSSEINVSIVIDDDSVDPDDITENRQLEKQDEMSQTLKTTTPSKADKKGKTFNTPKKNTEKESDKQPKYSLETSKRTRGSLSNSPKKSPEKEEGLDSSQKSNKSTKVTENPTEITEKSTKSTEVTKKSDKSSEVTEKSTEDTEKTKPEPLTTPKRTRGSLTKDTSKASLNDSSNSNLNSSQSSLMVTPKQVKKTDSQDKTGAEGSTPLTPKQLQRKLDSAKKRDEREKEKQEREQKRLQEKEERDKVKKEREDAKRREREEKEEAKKREREEKEEAKKKEKEEKERQRETEKKLREEKEEQKKREREEKEEQKKREREEKEEQRKKEKEAKEEEKRKQETEKQEQELKKKKAAEAFANFFVPKQKIDKEVSIGQVSGNTNILSSFTIKSDMRLAPTVRSDFNDDRKGVLDRSIETQGVGCEDLYVKSLKSGKAKPESSEKTWPLSERDDDVMIVEDELPPIDGDGSVITCESVAREKMRPKLFRFHENRRPPYWGTWRKKSVFVKPRRPFGQDEKLLDYSIDSDDEWEEEAEGESLDGSVAGSDTEPQDDEYELDNDVFVPHGYLSDEEATMDEEDVLKLSPEAQKARLKNLEDEFATELKKPTEKLKPRLYGLIWETSDGQKPEKCVDALWNYFGRFAMMIGDIDTLLKPAAEPEETEKKKIKKKKLVQEGETPSPKSDKKRKRTEKEPKEKTPKAEKKPKTPDTKKNQLGINTFLKKMKT